MTNKELTGAEIDSRYNKKDIVNIVDAPPIDCDHPLLKEMKEKIERNIRRYQTKIIGGHISTDTKSIDQKLRQQFA